MDEKKENVIQDSIRETKETEIDELEERKKQVVNFIKTHHYSNIFLLSVIIIQ